MTAFMVAYHHAQDHNPNGKPLFEIQGFPQNKPTQKHGNHRDQVDADGGAGDSYCLDTVVIKAKGTQGHAGA